MSVLKDIIIANFEALGLNGAVFTAGKSGKMPYGQIKKYFRGNDVVINPGTPSTTPTGKRTEDLQFYYHPDHLGSSNYITDASGEVYQHQEYFPFGETFVEERNDAEYTTYLFNGKELDEETGLYYYGARYYDPRTGIWQSFDPLSEKKSWLSPYHFCSNNPLNRIDPGGMSDYTVNKETGEVKLVNKNDNPDRILKTREFGKHKGEIQYKKNGEAKIAVKDIERGFLKDGMNLKSKDYIFDVEGFGQPTKEGFEDFALKLSNYIDKEVGGYYLSDKGSNSINHIYLAGFRNNTDQKASSGFNLNSAGRIDLFGKIDVKVDFHTHLSRFDDQYRLVPSSFGPDRGDEGHKERQLIANPSMKFIIITNPKTFPY